MQTIYVPILKCKQGEEKALSHLDSNIKSVIKPLLEIPYSVTSKKHSLCGHLQSFWSDYPFFFYFMPEWQNKSQEPYSTFISDKVLPIINQLPGTPVINLSSTEYIKNWKPLSKNGIAIRLRNNEFSEIASLLNPLFNSGMIEVSQTDLIFDLQHISSDRLDDITSLLDTTFSNLPNAHEYHSIIVASASFPKNTYTLDYSKIYQFNRIEDKIHNHLLNLSNQYGFHYLFSDYGTSDMEDYKYIPGIFPNFKIKYTSWENYLYIKGHSITKGGLDIHNVRHLAKLLVSSPDFSGPEFSWGDNIIYQIAEALTLSPGNLMNWISYNMNHHITLIAKEL